MIQMERKKYEFGTIQKKRLNGQCWNDLCGKSLRIVGQQQRRLTNDLAEFHGFDSVEIKRQQIEMNAKNVVSDLQQSNMEHTHTQTESGLRAVCLH